MQRLPSSHSESKTQQPAFGALVHLPASQASVVQALLSSQSAALVQVEPPPLALQTGGLSLLSSTHSWSAAQVEMVDHAVQAWFFASVPQAVALVPSQPSKA